MQGSLCLLVGLALIMVGTAPASAAQKRSISLTVSSTSVLPGTTVTLAGKVTRSSKGTRVRIEQLSGRRWTTFKTVRTTSAKGSFASAVRIRSSVSYRAVAPKTKKLGKVTSKVRKVAVRQAAEPAPPMPAPQVSVPIPPTAPEVPPRNPNVRVPQASDGSAANDHSASASISADGRYVAYQSAAWNIVPGDTYNKVDIFLWDRDTGTTIRVSQAADGNQADGDSFNPSISADGRYISFESRAPDLVPNDIGGSQDVFVWDRQTGLIVRASATPDGFGGNSTSMRSVISADGSYVAYSSYASNLVPDSSNGATNVYLWNRQTGATELVSRTAEGVSAHGYSDSAAISSDGRYVTYDSGAANIVPDDTNTDWDVFQWDRLTSTTTKISQAAGGDGANGGSTRASISSDGRFIAYSSYASNIVLGDTNNEHDVFLWDRQTASTTKVSVATDGGPTNGGSYSPSVSDDGRYVTFQSGASNVVPDDTKDWMDDVFVRDRQTGSTIRVSETVNGASANGPSRDTSISGNGQYVVYESEASNLVPGDSNGKTNVFVREING